MKGKYLILGSNVGDRKMHLQDARTKISKIIGPIVRVSSIYLSEPWGFREQSSFYNQIIQIKTGLSPHETLKAIMVIEKDLGRIRTGKWQERIIDIDILYFENHIIKEEKLTIPHPGIPGRRFVLEPLVELIPDEIHPVLGVSNTDLLSKTEDQLKVEKIILAGKMD